MKDVFASLVSASGSSEGRRRSGRSDIFSLVQLGSGVELSQGGSGRGLVSGFQASPAHDGRGLVGQPGDDGGLVGALAHDVHVVVVVLEAPKAVPEVVLVRARAHPDEASGSGHEVLPRGLDKAQTPLLNWEPKKIFKILNF